MNINKNKDLIRARKSETKRQHRAQVHIRSFLGLIVLALQQDKEEVCQKRVIGRIALRTVGRHVVAVS